MEKICDFCDDSDEIWASINFEDEEGGKCHFNICGDCSDFIISKNLTARAKLREKWNKG